MVVEGGGGIACFVSWRWFWVESGGFGDRMAGRIATAAVELLV